MRHILHEAAFLAKYLPPEKPMHVIKCILAELGLESSLSGYRCLLKAILAFHDVPGQSFTKELYENVGHSMEPPISAVLVERQLRYAIAKAWKDRDPEIWDCYFPHGQKPTSGELIARSAEVLHLCQACARRRALDAAKEETAQEI